MAEAIRLEVVTPDRVVVAVETEEVLEVPGGDGLFGVLPGHAPLMSTLTPGVVSYLKGKDSEAGLAVQGGFVIVQDDVVTVLADGAELPEEIDVEAARAALAAARGELPGVATLEEETAAYNRVAWNEGRMEAAARFR